MDLRDRDNCERVVAALQAVPESRFSELSAEIKNLMLVERSIDAEITDLERSISRSEIEHRMSASSAPKPTTMHVHAFYILNDNNSWTLRIDSDLSSFSDFINRVEFRVGSTERVVWERQEIGCRPFQKLNGVTLTREWGHISEVVPVHVALFLGYPDQLYEVPGEEFRFLANHSRFCTLVDLFKIICMYIKSKQLSSDDDPSYFTPDPTLHRMLYPQHPVNHPVSFASLLETMKMHFKNPAGPFEFTVQVDPNNTSPTTTEQVYAITVEVPQLPDESVSNNLKGNKLTLIDTVQQLDNKLAAELVTPIEENRDKAVFLSKLAQNPVGLLQDILKNPTGTAKNVQSLNSIDYSKMATSDDFYRLPWAVAAAAHIVQDQKTLAS